MGSVTRVRHRPRGATRMDLPEFVRSVGGVSAPFLLIGTPGSVLGHGPKCPPIAPLMRSSALPLRSEGVTPSSSVNVAPLCPALLVGETCGAESATGLKHEYRL